MKTILHGNLFTEYEIAIYAIDEHDKEIYLTENADTIVNFPTLKKAIEYYEYEKSLLHKNYKKFHKFDITLSLVTEDDFIPLISETIMI